MAKEILEAVKNAEAECESIVAKAKSSAKAIVEDAEKQAAENLKKSDGEANAEAEKKLGEVKLECEGFIINAQKSAEAECAALSALAETNRESVIKQAVEKFF